MKWSVDKHYAEYSVYTAIKSGICVKCPKCNGLGIVTADNDNAYFKCTSCGNTITKECAVYHYDVHNQCKRCGQYYRVDITEKSKQHFNMLHVVCTFCGYIMSGKVQKTVKGFLYIGEIKNACEPFFGFELWFLAYFGEKFVWALNREHLTYLIDYLNADLRKKPVGFNSVKTQADYLPTFMKIAKNRNRIVRLLKNMQQK